MPDLNFNINGNAGSFQSALNSAISSLSQFSATLAKLPNVSRAAKAEFQGVVGSLDQLSSRLDAVNNRVSVGTSRAVTVGILNFRNLTQVMKGFAYDISYAINAFDKFMSIFDKFKLAAYGQAALFVNRVDTTKIPLAEGMRVALDYTKDLQKTYIGMNSESAASIEQMQLVGIELAKWGITITKNKEDLEGFKNLTNAIAVLVSDMPNKMIQFGQETRSVLEGNARQGSTLALIFRSQLGPAWHKILMDSIENHTFWGKITELTKGFSLISKDIERTWAAVSSTFVSILMYTTNIVGAPLFDVLISKMVIFNQYVLTHIDDIQKRFKGWIDNFIGVVKFLSPLFGTIVTAFGIALDNLGAALVIFVSLKFLPLLAAAGTAVETFTAVLLTQRMALISYAGSLGLLTTSLGSLKAIIWAIGTTTMAFQWTTWVGIVITAAGALYLLHKKMTDINNEARDAADQAKFMNLQQPLVMRDFETRHELKGTYAEKRDQLQKQIIQGAQPVFEKEETTKALKPARDKELQDMQDYVDVYNRIISTRGKGKSGEEDFGAQLQALLKKAQDGALTGNLSDLQLAINDWNERKNEILQDGEQVSAATELAAYEKIQKAQTIKKGKIVTKEEASLLKKIISLRKAVLKEQLKEQAEDFKGYLKALTDQVQFASDNFLTQRKMKDPFGGKPPEFLMGGPEDEEGGKTTAERGHMGRATDLLAKAFSPDQLLTDPLQSWQDFIDGIKQIVSSGAENLRDAWAPVIANWLQGFTRFDEFFRDMMLSIYKMFMEMIAKMIATEAIKFIFTALTIPLPTGLAVGTEYVPRDMPAVVHKGEAIIPRTMNQAIMSGKATYGTATQSNHLIASLINKVDALSQRPIMNVFDFGDEQLKVFNKNSNRIQYSMEVNG